MKILRYFKTTRAKWIALSIALVAVALPKVACRLVKPSADDSGSAGRAKELLPVGADAPDVTLSDENGNPVRIGAFRGDKNVVLVFYPGDRTPGCTKQLCAIRDDFARFEARDTVVFGVNPQSAESHRDFIEKRNFPFPLLVDGDKRAVHAYGCEGILATIRTVYAIDKEGKIVFAQRGMPSTAEILEALGQ
ncbi:redoxin domain-containing protein [Candidatus Sumerlaeota bacterium]|nr:redoxin domain-containing protein [Candidatus Sumerlaeota bacterium]